MDGRRIARELLAVTRLVAMSAERELDSNQKLIDKVLGFIGEAKSWSMLSTDESQRALEEAESLLVRAVRKLDIAWQDRDPLVASRRRGEQTMDRQRVARKLVKLARGLVSAVRGPDPTGERQRILDYLQELAEQREREERGRGLTSIVRQMNFVETKALKAVEDKYPALIKKALGRKPKKRVKAMIREGDERDSWELVDVKTRRVLKDGFKSVRDAADYIEEQDWVYVSKW